MKKGTKLYLDNCCFNRPYDDQSSLPIRLETEAKLDIQEKIESNELSLGWSYILDFENNANPFVERKIEIQRWRELANSFALESEEILFEMDKLTAIGLKAVDALHVACAIYLNCEYFLTVDKEIIKKAYKISQIKIVNPITLVIGKAS
ncbi:PIN domain-containing protein [Candidatus Thiosymbion oneisti]|uniref:PIN domain-containing protein n=1 Tax=Candidatus Thiosymbion oneisti TaxID=589554 RepID=UPI000AD9B733|nr:PIN domain-containing protein [Candidatus Thiosymbion oneisti]